MSQPTDPLTTLRALADPTRCRILELLHRESQSVSDLARHFSMTRPAVSKHLAILREAELVSSRRQGRQQIYELDPAPLAEIRAWLSRFDAGAKAAGVETRPPARRAPRSPSGRDDWRSW